MTLTRIDLESGRLQTIISQAGLELQILTQAQLQQSVDETLQQCSKVSDVWIFAYGETGAEGGFPAVGNPRTRRAR